MDEKSNSNKPKKANVQRLVDDSDEGDEHQRLENILSGKKKNDDGIIQVKTHKKMGKKDRKIDVNFKKKLLNILDKSGYANSRSRTLGSIEFLDLLSVFNEHGIHFK